MRLLLLSSLICIGLSTHVRAQTKIKDGTVTGSASIPNTAAILELESNNKGLLLPRVALANTTAWGLAGTGVAGMQVFNTSMTIVSTNTTYPIIPGGLGVYSWDGTGWVGVSPASFTNIYTADGTLAGNRTVTMGEDVLNFTGNSGSITMNNTTLYNGPNLILTTATATGRANLQLTGGSSNMYIFLDANNEAQITSNATSLNFGMFSTAPITMFTSNSERVRIDPAGNVGIGSSTPSSTLQVVGSISTNIVTVAGDYTLSGTDYTVIYTGGTTAPVFTLPDPTTCKGRMYRLVNASNNTASQYQDINLSSPVFYTNGQSSTTVSVITLTTANGLADPTIGNTTIIQSDGNIWWRIGL